MIAFHLILAQHPQWFVDTWNFFAGLNYSIAIPLLASLGAVVFYFVQFNHFRQITTMQKESMDQQFKSMLNQQRPIAHFCKKDDLSAESETGVPTLYVETLKNNKTVLKFQYYIHNVGSGILKPLMATIVAHNTFYENFPEDYYSAQFKNDHSIEAWTIKPFSPPLTPGNYRPYDFTVNLPAESNNIYIEILFEYQDMDNNVYSTTKRLELLNANIVPFVQDENILQFDLGIDLEGFQSYGKGEFSATAAIKKLKNKS